MVSETAEHFFIFLAGATVVLTVIMFIAAVGVLVRMPRYRGVSIAYAVTLLVGVVAWACWLLDGWCGCVDQEALGLVMLVHLWLLLLTAGVSLWLMIFERERGLDER